MRTALALLLLASTPLVHAAGLNPLDDQLIANERALVDAVVHNDLARFRTLVAPDGITVDATGIPSAGALEARVLSTTVTASTLGNLRVQWVNASAALVTATWSGAGTIGTQPLPARVHTSTLWVKRDGRWQATFHQETPGVDVPQTALTRR